MFSLSRLQTAVQGKIYYPGPEEVEMKDLTKLQELKGLSREELLQKEKALKEELYKLNLQRYSGRVEKPHMFGLIKRDIARIETILNEKRK
jgi:large subunit ribosomal protein L29